MAEFTVRNTEDDIKVRLKRRVARLWRLKMCGILRA